MRRWLWILAALSGCATGGGDNRPRPPCEASPRRQILPLRPVVLIGCFSPDLRESADTLLNAYLEEGVAIKRVKVVTDPDSFMCLVRRYRREDLLILHLIGHGNREGPFEVGGFRFARLVQLLRAWSVSPRVPRIFITVEACYSGRALELLRDLDYPRGLYVVTGQTADSVSYLPDMAWAIAQTLRDPLYQVKINDTLVVMPLDNLGTGIHFQLGHRDLPGRFVHPQKLSINWSGAWVLKYAQPKPPQGYERRTGEAKPSPRVRSPSTAVQAD